MNTTLRAVLFGVVASMAMTLAFNAVTTSQVQAVRLDGVQVTAHRDHFDSDGNLKASTPITAVARSAGSDSI